MKLDNTLLKKYAAVAAGIIIALTFIAMIIVAILRYDSPEEQRQQAALEEIKPVKRYLEIRNDCYSVVVEPTEKLPRITWGAIGDDVPYRVFINGGKEAGGIEYDVPAYKDWDRLGWKSPKMPNLALEVKFRHLKPGSAKVWCQIEPL
ncbi:MAG: hypothetical protein AAB909_03415 [Patescibacteria group bacterium]